MSIPTFIASAMAYALAHGEWAGIDAGERAKAFWALFSSYAYNMVQNDPFLRGSRLMLFSKGDPADAAFARTLWPEAKMAAQSDVATVWVVE
jgi:hypothetical protein